MRTFRISLLAAAVVLVAIAAALAYRHFLWKPATLAATQLAVDLAAPDAAIVSASLSKLPRDLLRVPVLREVLTEDIVFYYEQHEDRLGLKGSLRRIAWEHQLDWSDRILGMALDEPAELAFWRDGNGALRHYALVMRRGAMARVLQQAAAVALKDRQLTRLQDAAGHGLDFPVYALRIGPRRTLIIAVRGERIAVLSDPGMLLDAKGRFVAASRDALSSWLRADGALTSHFRLGAARSTHALAVGASAFALGYEDFVPGVEALRIDLAGDTWSTRLLLRPGQTTRKAFDDAALWSAAPANAGACLLLPLDARMPAKVVQKALSVPEASSAIACWYPHSTLYAPLFVARMAKSAAENEALFAGMAKWALRKPGFSSGQEKDATLARDPAPLPRREAGGGAQTWRAAGATPDASRRHVTALLAAPTLAASGTLGVFSPDAALVDLAIDTIARRHPGVADQLPREGVTLAVVTPRMLAGMVAREAGAAVPRAHESVLSAALKTHLAPRLAALAKYPAHRLVLDADAARRDGWQPARWEPLE